MASKFIKPDKNRNRAVKKKSIAPSLEEIEKALEESGLFADFEPLVPSIEERLLSGYMYTIDSGKGERQDGTRNIRISTGVGGVKLYVDACRKNGIPDRMIAQSIIVNTDMGPVTLDNLTVKDATK